MSPRELQISQLKVAAKHSGPLIYSFPRVFQVILQDNLHRSPEEIHPSCDWAEVSILLLSRWDKTEFVTLKLQNFLYHSETFALTIYK